MAILSVVHRDRCIACHEREAENPPLRRISRFHGTAGEAATGSQLGVRVQPRELAEQAEWVVLVHGDSERWRSMLKARDRRVGVIKGAYFLLKAGAMHSVRHFFFLVQHPWNGAPKASRPVP